MGNKVRLRTKKCVQCTSSVFNFDIGILYVTDLQHPLSLFNNNLNASCWLSFPFILFFFQTRMSKFCETLILSVICLFIKKKHEWPRNGGRLGLFTTCNKI